MHQRSVGRLLIAGVITSPVAALYCLGGVIQAASLFTGVKAQRNYELWGSLFLLFVVIFVGCGVALAIRKWKGQLEASRSKSAI